MTVEAATKVYYGHSTENDVERENVRVFPELRSVPSREGNALVGMSVIEVLGVLPGILMKTSTVRSDHHRPLFEKAECMVREKGATLLPSCNWLFSIVLHSRAGKMWKDVEVYINIY